MLNDVKLIGRIGRDPQLENLKNGSSVLNIAIGTNENRKDKEGNWEEVVTWHDVQVWGKRAESLSSRLKKGDLIYLSGKIDYNQYEDKNGSTQRRAKIKAYDVKRLTKSEK